MNGNAVERSCAAMVLTVVWWLHFDWEENMKK